MTGLALPCVLVCTGHINGQTPSSAGKWALNVAPGPQNAGRGCLVTDHVNNHEVITWLSCTDHVDIMH